MMMFLGVSPVSLDFQDLLRIIRLKLNIQPVFFMELELLVVI